MPSVATRSGAARAKVLVFQCVLGQSNTLKMQPGLAHIALNHRAVIVRGRRAHASNLAIVFIAVIDSTHAAIEVVSEAVSVFVVLVAGIADVDALALCILGRRDFDGSARLLGS